MRKLFKVLLFPVTLALSLIVATSRFLCSFSSALLSVLSSIIFLVAVLALLLLKDPMAALNASVIAFVISPYGIPRLVEWLVDRLDDFNYFMQSI